VAETAWTVSRESKLGRYVVTLREAPERKGEQGRKRVRVREFRGWTSGSLRVEEFRIPLMKGVLQPLTGPLVNAKDLKLDLSVHYLAGGGAGLLPIRLRTEISPKSLSPLEGFDGFIFGNGPVKEGVVRRGEALGSEEGGAGTKRSMTPAGANS